MLFSDNTKLGHVNNLNGEREKKKTELWFYIISTQTNTLIRFSMEIRLQDINLHNYAAQMKWWVDTIDCPCFPFLPLCHPIHPSLHWRTWSFPLNWGRRLGFRDNVGWWCSLVWKEMCSDFWHQHCVRHSQPSGQALWENVTGWLFGWLVLSRTSHEIRTWTTRDGMLQRQRTAELGEISAWCL